MLLKMPNSFKRETQGQSSLKPKAINSKTSCDLRRLLFLLEKPWTGQEVATVSCGRTNSVGARSEGVCHLNNTSRNEGDTATEMSLLEQFSITYKCQRCFRGHPQHKLFSGILSSLVRNRLCREWIDHASPESALRILICLRLLIRDSHYQVIFHQLQGVDLLARYLEMVTDQYTHLGEDPFVVQNLITMTYMIQKLSAVEGQRDWVMQSGAYRSSRLECLFGHTPFCNHTTLTLARLLSTRDSGVLLGALIALTPLVESAECKERIGELPVVEDLLVILQEYDLLSKRMAAELLRLLMPVRQVRQQVRDLEGLPILLGLLHGRHLKLLWSATWVLVQLCEDPHTRAEVRSWGGLQQLLRLLSSEGQYVADRSSIEALSSANAAGRIKREHGSEELTPQEHRDNTMALHSACCAALTELVLDDANAFHLVQENGVYVIAKLILPQGTAPKAVSLQCYAFRTLRFIFSVERNRTLFRRLFPTDLFELFIDIGHYVRDLTAYEGLQSMVSLYTRFRVKGGNSPQPPPMVVVEEEELLSLRESIGSADQNRPPLRVINGYSILDHLGTGAFGSVFKVRKQSGQNLFALKEVNLRNPAFGKDKRSRDSSVEKIVSELSIIREQMAHPNIVKYYKTFFEGDRLYIVMELVEGLTLADHFSALKEKQQKFTEDRIWNVFIQMCLALRYLHKEKHIVHRDLTPNNIMLADRDKVTITDFGLAKQKQESSRLTSVVGTVLYSCPEIVKNEPYGEKADIWALGCVLYQMASLRTPFYSTNMLSLATKIVEAVYEPVEEGLFSQRVTDMIQWCLSPDPDVRPDIVAVSSRISDIMMRMMDILCTSHHTLERRADRDRKLAQKYFLERNKGQISCHSNPSQASQDKEELMRTEPSASSSSSAACGLNDCQQHGGRDDVSDEDVATSDIRNKSDKPGGSYKTTIPPAVGLHGDDCAAPKMKLRPASAGICISQKKLRELDDPIQRLLVLLHKILYITQLPPAPHHNSKRRLIDRFKRSLFHQGSSAFNLKLELSKLLQASPELVEFGATSSDWWPRELSIKGPLHAAENYDNTEEVTLRDGISYQQMQAVIEEVLADSRYYDRT